MALLSPAARQGTGPLARLMREGGLYCVFQPLADLREGQVYAHEALIRGPQNTPLHTPDKLLELARHEGILQDFELLCVYTAMEQWGRHDAPGRLFVNISADALVHGVQLIGATELGNTVVATNVQCVFEAYVADNKLSERRAAGVKAKCEALGYVW